MNLLLFPGLEKKNLEHNSISFLIADEDGDDEEETENAVNNDDEPSDLELLGETFGLTRNQKH